MKNYFHNDVDNENVEIANLLFEDSKQFSDDNIVKPTLDNIINKNTTSKKGFKKSQIFAMASALAACILLMFVIDYTPRTNSSLETTIGFSESNYTAVSFAEEYAQIKNKLLDLANNKFSVTTEYEYGYLQEGLVGGWDTDMAGTSSNKANGSHGLHAEDTVVSSSNLKNDSDYYDTNEQTENVHEADVVKTNGEYIFTLDGFGSRKIYLTKVDGLKMETVNTIIIDDTIKNVTEDTYVEEFYLYNNYLVAVAVDWSDDYDETLILVFDIANPKNIKLLSSHIQEGEYISSRMQGHYLYTITNDYSNENILYDDAKLDEPENYIPKVDGCIISPSNICIPEQIDSSDFTIVTGLDITKSKDFTTTKSILGGASDIYVSQNNIYILRDTYIQNDLSDTKLGQNSAKKYKVYDNFEYPLPKDYRSRLNYYIDNKNKELTDKDFSSYLDTEIYEETVATEIIKYNYKDGKIKYIASNSIPGSAENNLNFDEYGDFLRCVTTENSISKFTTYINCYDKKGDKVCRFVFDDYTLKTEEDSNNVIVLSENLEQVAVIDNLAKGESIYSARYFGDYGYFVTYEQTDPLFSVDFSDITNPKIIGKLKMPGVSEYLHFYDDNLLLGFGYEDVNLDTYLKLEMYNISNNSAKKESKKLIIDFAESDALYNYKAIMIDPEKNLIGFAAAADDEYVIGLEEDIQYYLLYTYKNGDFEELLRVEIPSNAYNTRGFYIGDYLYIVCPEYSIRAINMKTYNEDQKVEKLKLE